MTRTQLEHAITMTAKRRAKADDANRELLPNAPDSDPRDVLDYLQKYSGPDIPRWVLQADVCDALTLINWLWWDDRRRELHFLKSGRTRGIFLAQLGAQVGIGKQGVVDRIDRLDALLRYNRPDEKIVRAARHADRQTRERLPVQQAWLIAHRDELASVVSGLVSQADRYQLEDAERDWLDQLSSDLRDDTLAPATIITMLGLATAEIRTAPAVLALNSPRPHAIHHLLIRADRLRSAFVDETSMTSPKAEAAISS